MPLHGHQAYQLNPYNTKLDDPSLYGLHVFCCPLAVYTLGMRFGADVLPEVEFLWQPSQHIAQFIETAPYSIFYFILCDRERPLQLRFLSLPISQALAVLRGQISLADYSHLTQEYT